MAMRYYEGELGKFDYDNEEFMIVNSPGYLFIHNLKYIGSETDGLKIKIPDGLKSGVRMFMGCEFLETPPVLPDSMRYCTDMFNSCTSLRVPPDIPHSVTDCRRMFEGCISLEHVPVIIADLNGYRLRYVDMFKGCSDKIQEQGKWNLEHRGHSYDEYMTKRASKKVITNRGSEFEDIVEQDNVQKGLGE